MIKATKASTNQKFVNDKKKNTENKMSSGKVITRPKMLEEKHSKIYLLKQSAIVASSKSGKSNLSELPKGVQDSIKNKERIDSIINRKNNNSVDSMKNKYDIDGKPLTLKRAKMITEERNSFFNSNRNKKTISVPTETETSKVVNLSKKAEGKKASVSTKKKETKVASTTKKSATTTKKKNISK